jgi:glycine cleavage system aminomethyltransferase T
MANTTAFEKLHISFNARFGEYGDWLVPSVYSDVDTEYAAIQNGIAAVDLSAFGRISITEASAIDALNSITELDIAMMDENSWAYTAVVTPGREQAKPARVIHTISEYTLLTMPSDTQYVISVLESVNGSCDGIKNISSKTAMLGLYGPKALELVTKILPVDISGIEPGQVMTHKVFMMNLTGIRGSWAGGDGVEIICPSMAAQLAGSSIEKYSGRYNIVPAGMEALTLAIRQSDMPHKPDTLK